MMTPIDAVEWLLYTSDALVARMRVDTRRLATTLHLRTPR